MEETFTRAFETLVISSLSAEEGEESYSFLVKVPQNRYAGTLVIVRYVWNWDFHNCPENGSLRDLPTSVDRDGNILEVSPQLFESHILPALTIPPKVDAIQLTVTTIGDGMIAIGSMNEYVDESLIVLEDDMPIALPRVSIHSLSNHPLHLATREEDAVYKFRTVTWDEDHDTVYGLKDGGIDHAPEAILEMWPRLLDELYILHSAESPFLDKPSHIVYNPHNSTYRGFLRPFHRRGTISYAITKGTLKSFGAATLLKWMSQIVSVVILLHSKEIYGLNINPSHVVITDNDDICVISVSPWKNCLLREQLPPEYAEAEGGAFVSPASDIWCLGVLFWQMWEALLPLEYAEDIRDRTWSEGESATPAWVKELTEQCLSDTPEERPTATQVSERLELETSSYLASLR